MSTTIKVLRWIAIPPSVILGSWLTYFVMLIAVRFGLGSQVDPESIRYVIGEAVMVHLAMGAAFVYIAAYVAPDHKQITAVITATIGVLIMGASLLLAVSQSQWFFILAIAAFTVGAVGTVAAVYSGEVAT